MNQQKLPSDRLKEPRRPWVTVGVIAAVVVGASSVGAGAYALTQDSAPAVPRAAYDIPSNTVPVALIDVAKSHLKVTVDGTGSTDPDGQIVSYLWDFGDGTTSESPSGTHKYSKAGEYTITLTVTDDGSRPADATATESVTVKAAPPPPPAAPAEPAAGASGSLVPFIPSDDPNNANGGDYIDPSIYCQSGSASGNPPRCD